MLNVFVKKNENTAIEIVTLQDIGYMLADSQGDLTLKQKIFLTYAVPMVREKQEQHSQKDNSTASSSLKNRVREKRKENANKKKMG